MKLQLCLVVLFICFSTVHSGPYETLLAYQDNVFEEYPNIACALCRGAAQENCRDCPFLEDISLCEFIEEYELFTGREANIHKDMSLPKDFRGNCSSGYGSGITFGHVLAGLETATTPDPVQCILCNLVIGLIDFVTNEIVLSSEFRDILTYACDHIKGCVPDAVDKLIYAFEEIVANLYVAIGVKILNCPDYQQFVNNCFGG